MIKLIYILHSITHPINRSIDLSSRLRIPHASIYTNIYVGANGKSVVWCCFALVVVAAVFSSSQSALHPYLHPDSHTSYQ